MMITEANFTSVMFDGKDVYKNGYSGRLRDCIKDFETMCLKSGAEWGHLILIKNGYRVFSYSKISENEKMVKSAVMEAIDNGWAWRHIVSKLVDENDKLDEGTAFRWACEEEGIVKEDNPWSESGY